MNSIKRSRLSSKVRSVQIIYDGRLSERIVKPSPLLIPYFTDQPCLFCPNNVTKPQVQRTASSDAHDNVGGQLTLKGFTAALLACCSSPSHGDRLFRSLRGQGEDWRRYGGAGEQEDGANVSSPRETAAIPTGAPTFVTQLAAYRRKVRLGQANQ